MNKNKLILLPILAFMALFVSGCTGSPADWAGLSADGQHAYVANGTLVYAVNLSDGKEAWRYPAQADSKQLYFASPVVTPDGQLLIGSQGSKPALLSLDPKTGKENWAAPFTAAKGLWVASPLVFNEHIYAPNTDGFIYVLDMHGVQVGNPIAVGGALWSSPATDGKQIYIASLDHHFHVIDPSSASAADPIDLGGAAPSAPLAAADGAYVGSFNSKIEFVSASGQSQDIATAGNWIWGTPVLDGNTLYYADLNGTVYSYDVTNKKQNWNNVKPDGPIVARVLLAKDQLYVASEDGALTALDRSAKVVWSKTVGGKIYTSPVSAGDLILVVPYQADFLLAAYDSTGKQAWTFTPAK